MRHATARHLKACSRDISANAELIYRFDVLLARYPSDSVPIFFQKTATASGDTGRYITEASKTGKEKGMEDREIIMLYLDRKECAIEETM